MIASELPTWLPITILFCYGSPFHAPNWLLLDTACPRAVVALTRENTVLAEIYLHEYKRHGELLSSAIESCLNQASLQVTDISAVAVGMGPGSFIGVRIAMAHAKGLCIALHPWLVLIPWQALSQMVKKWSQLMLVETSFMY